MNGGETFLRQEVGDEARRKNVFGGAIGGVNGIGLGGGEVVGVRVGVMVVDGGSGWVVTGLLVLACRW